jgi:recombination protein RecA
MSKAKVNSTRLRSVVSRIKRHGSILIIISQVRDNISTMSRASETQAGGRALLFYSTISLWTKQVETIQKTYKGEKRRVGSLTECNIKKNRLTGKEWSCRVPILNGYGVDDIGSMVDYLIDEKVFEMKKQTVVAESLGISATREKLIAQIEEKGLEGDLQDITQQAFDEIQEALKPNRKKRYD